MPLGPKLTPPQVSPGTWPAFNRYLYVSFKQNSGERLRATGPSCLGKMTPLQCLYCGMFFFQCEQQRRACELKTCRKTFLKKKIHLDRHRKTHTTGQLHQQLAQQQQQQRVQQQHLHQQLQQWIQRLALQQQQQRNEQQQWIQQQDHHQQ